LPSKSRFIACQFLALLEKDLWKSVAQHELNCAQRMLEGLKQIPSIEISYPVESNAVFARLPRNIIHNLRKDYFFYVWDENQNEVRLMMSFDTQFEEIDRFCQCASQLLATNEAERPKRGTNL
jgi:threonine aldolase